MNAEEVLIIFGKNLRKYRENAGYSIEKLSEKTKINIQYLNKIENGKARRLPYYYVFLLAQAISVKPHDLCDGI